MFTQVRSRSVILKLAMVRFKLYVQLLFFFLEFSDSHIYFADLVIKLLSTVQLNLFLLEISKITDRTDRNTGHHKNTSKLTE